MTDLDRVALVVELVRLEDLFAQYVDDKREPEWSLSCAHIRLVDARMMFDLQVMPNHVFVRIRTDLHEARKYLADVKP